MDLKELRETIVESDDLTAIYNAHLDLEEGISELYKELEDVEERDERIRIKSDLTLANSLRKISIDRQKNLNNSEVVKNYNFRMAAKTVLTKPTYNVLMDLAAMPRRDVKAIEPELLKKRLDR